MMRLYCLSRIFMFSLKRFNDEDKALSCINHQVGLVHQEVTPPTGSCLIIDSRDVWSQPKASQIGPKCNEIGSEKFQDLSHLELIEPILEQM